MKKELYKNLPPCKVRVKNEKETEEVIKLAESIGLRKAWYNNGVVGVTLRDSSAINSSKYYTWSTKKYFNMDLEPEITLQTLRKRVRKIISSGMELEDIFKKGCSVVVKNDHAKIRETVALFEDLELGGRFDTLLKAAIKYDTFCIQYNPSFCQNKGYATKVLPRLYPKDLKRIHAEEMAKKAIPKYWWMDMRELSKEQREKALEACKALGMAVNKNISLHHVLYFSTRIKTVQSWRGVNTFKREAIGYCAQDNPITYEQLLNATGIQDVLREEPKPSPLEELKRNVEKLEKDLQEYANANSKRFAEIRESILNFAEKLK